MLNLCKTSGNEKKAPWQSPIIPNWPHLKRQYGALTDRLDILPLSCIEAVRVIIKDPYSKKSSPYYWVPLNEDFVPYNEHFPEGYKYNRTDTPENKPFNSTTVPSHPCQLFRSQSKSAAAERHLNNQITADSIRQLAEDSDVDTDDPDEE